ncbi:hypothetical protein ACL02R_11495 [Streptomyces sp. MS19]|uniref:hypothetical protein n=1 Tax=Streptomyces sp. MS19 TaxID=3385972 RepID=UPI0039A30F3A
MSPTPLAAQAFFDKLDLPYESAVLGDVYYAVPQPALPQRLRISFHPTDPGHLAFDGLDVAVLQPTGPVDQVTLLFAHHATFTARDRAKGLRPGAWAYATFYPPPSPPRRSAPPPWAGADVTGLRTAITRYVEIWFPAPLQLDRSQTAHQRPSTPAPSTGRPRTR